MQLLLSGPRICAFWRVTDFFWLFFSDIWFQHIFKNIFRNENILYINQANEYEFEYRYSEILIIKIDILTKKWGYKHTQTNNFDKIRFFINEFGISTFYFQENKISLFNSYRHSYSVLYTLFSILQCMQILIHPGPSIRHPTDSGWQNH